MYMLSREYRVKYFSIESRPTEMTIRNWIKSNKIEGRKIGGLYYVLISENETKPVIENDITPNYSA